MDSSWASLRSLVSPQLLSAIEGTLGYKEMTPVQAACIPQFLNYKDVVAEAVTGSGKTIAFLVPLLQILLRRDAEWGKHQVGGIIIAPTRELATQISSVLEKLLLSLPIVSQLLFIGGTSVEEDLTKFQNQGGNVLIVTPGRFHDLLMRREGGQLKTSLKYLEVLILDEADCLLSMGFEKPLNAILQMLPKQRRTGLFSATQTTEVTKLIRAGLRNPVSVVVVDKGQRGKAPASLDNNYCIVEPQSKFEVLINFIQSHRKQKLLIFFSTCACVDYFSYVLKRLLKGLSVLSIHGKLKESVRAVIFDKFRESEEGILCCTDVMARGVDVTKKINWVIQFDPPSNPSSFIHRSGRTARNGEEGTALLMLQPNEQDYVNFLQVSQKVKLNSMDTTSFSNNESGKLLESVRKLQLADRTIYDKGVRAFVSYYKAYSRYDCNLILRVKDLDLGAIGTCYGLIKFPKMSELKGRTPSNFEEVDVDINSIPYLDKQKEMSRKRKLDAFQETGKWPEKDGKRKFQQLDSSWSVAKGKKAQKQKRKAKKEMRKNSGLSSVEIVMMEKCLQIPTTK